MANPPLYFHLSPLDTTLQGGSHLAAGAKSIEAVEYAALEWADGFNNRRLFEPIGNIPIAEAEANYYAALKETDIAA